MQTTYSTSKSTMVVQQMAETG